MLRAFVNRAESPPHADGERGNQIVGASPPKESVGALLLIAPARQLTP